VQQAACVFIANLAQVGVGQLQAMGQVVTHGIATAEVAAVQHMVCTDDIDQRLAHRYFMQLNVEVEVFHVLEQRLFVVFDVEVLVGLGQTTELVRDIAAAMGDVHLKVREAIQYAAANQVPETTAFVVLHANDGGGFVTVVRWRSCPR